MNNLIKKYLKIAKGSVDLNVTLNQGLKDAAKSNTLGRYLYENYDLVELVFAEIDYMQFKFSFNCITEEFVLKRYPSSYGVKNIKPVGPYESDERRKKAYEQLMKKSLSFNGVKNGWVFENIGYTFDATKRKERLEKSKPEKINIVNKINPNEEKPFNPLNPPKSEEASVADETDVATKDEVVVVEENNDTQDKFVIFGDSQIAGNIGIELESTYGGYREGVSSTKATYWLEQIKSGTVSEELNSKPSNVIILLGGNGTENIKELLDEVHIITPKSMIHFISLPSPAIPSNGNVTRYSAVFGKKKVFNFSKLHSSREKRKNTSRDLVMASVPASKGLVQFVNIFDIAWECEEECDGIHVTPRAAKDIVSSISLSTKSTTLSV